jgi:hypothetical protein
MFVVAGETWAAGTGARRRQEILKRPDLTCGESKFDAGSRRRSAAVPKRSVALIHVAWADVRGLRKRRAFHGNCIKHTTRCAK